MIDPSTEERLRQRAERTLRLRAHLVDSITVLLVLLLIAFWGVVWSTWARMTPGVASWADELVKLVGNATAGTVLDKALSAPGGFPWPLIVMFVSYCIASLVNLVAQAIFNYVNFSKVDAVEKVRDRAMRREVNTIMRREGLAPGWLERTFDWFQGQASSVQEPLARKLDKISRWIQMYEQVPEAPGHENAKIKREQVVRLTDDGELLVDEQVEAHGIASTGRRKT